MAEQVANAEQFRRATLDVDAQRLALIYAEAGLDAAGALPQQQALAEELTSLETDLLDRNPRLEEMFGSGLISEDEKLAMLDRVFGGRASAAALNTLKVMAEHGRLGHLRAVIQAVQKLWKTRSGRVRVEVETPLPLDAALEKEIVAALRTTLGKEPDVVSRVNSDLLAGFVIRVGDKVYDSSARTSLERTRQAMIERATETIQTRPKQFMGG